MYYNVIHVYIYIYYTVSPGFPPCPVLEFAGHMNGTCAAAGLSLESRTREGFVSCIPRLDVFLFES